MGWKTQIDLGGFICNVGMFTTLVNLDGNLVLFEIHLENIVIHLGRQDHKREVEVMVSSK